MTPSEIERFPLALESLFSDFEMEVMADIVRRIVINGEITSTADWQLVRLKELGQSNDYIAKTLAIMLKRTTEDVKTLYEEALKQEYIRDKDLYIATNKEFIPYHKNEQLKQVVNAIAKQTIDTFNNITGTTGFVKQVDGNLVSVERTKYFTDTLDKAMLEITTGTHTKEQVIKKVITEMTNSGLRTIDYKSGSTSRLNVAARRALSTGLGQVTAKVSEYNLDALETDFVEVSWHNTARTGIGVANHQEWQGYVYHWNRHNTDSQGYKDFVESTGYGDNPLGLHGYNCRHNFYPFVIGVSTREYTDEQLQQMRDKENKKTMYEGKGYTVYEATQYMRELESKMRIQRQRIKLLKESDVNKEDLTAERSKYRITMSKYVNFADKMGLPQQRQRIYEDGLGRV